MRKIGIFTILVISLVFCLSLVSAVNLVSPSDDSVISGNNVILNATGTNLINCTFYAKSVSTANNTWSKIGFFKNNTANDGDINGTFNSASLEDSSDYIFNATCYDTSGNVGSDINTGITIDNTAPTSPTSLSPSTNSIDDDGTVTFSATVDGTKTTSCTLYFVDGNPGSSSYVMIHSGNNCTKTLTNIPEQTYKWYVEASDGLNTSVSSTNIVTIDITTGSGKIIQKVIEEEKNKGKKEIISKERIIGIPIWFIVLLVIVIVILCIIFRNKK